MIISVNKCKEWRTLLIQQVQHNIFKGAKKTANTSDIASGSSLTNTGMFPSTGMEEGKKQEKKIQTGLVYSCAL